MNPKCKRHNEISCAICYPFLINDRSVDQEKPSLLRNTLPPEEQKPRFHVSDCVYGGKRVWVEWVEFEPWSHKSSERSELFAILDNLSKWGGADKRGDRFYSWEMSDEYMPKVYRAMQRYMYVKDVERIPEWLR